MSSLRSDTTLVCKVFHPTVINLSSSLCLILLLEMAETEAESALGSSQDALSGIRTLGKHPQYSELVAEYAQGQYQKVLRRPEAQELLAQFLDRPSARKKSPSSYHVWKDEQSDEIGSALALLTGRNFTECFPASQCYGTSSFVSLHFTRRKIGTRED